MTETYIYICAGVVLALIVIILLFRLVSRRKELSGRDKFIHDTFNDAISQNSSFDIKLIDSVMHAGLVAQLAKIDSTTLTMRVNGDVSKEWHAERVEGFFRVKQDIGPVFFVFESSVIRVKAENGKSEIVLAMPDHLRVEKKRHFIRAHPDQNDILMLAAWPLLPGKRLPRANSDMGQPPVSWKTGQAEKRVQVENVSGSGLALRFASPQGETLPFNASKGRQVICLVVYRAEPKPAKPAVLWCAGEIMNVRQMGDACSLGLELTNWAIQEQGDTEIHWMHCSPWRGAKPLLKWAQRADEAQNA